jgi:hypothetical protein
LIKDKFGKEYISIKSIFTPMEETILINESK